MSANYPAPRWDLLLAGLCARIIASIRAPEADSLKAKGHDHKGFKIQSGIFSGQAAAVVQNLFLPGIQCFLNCRQIRLSALSTMDSQICYGLFSVHIGAVTGWANQFAIIFVRPTMDFKGASFCWHPSFSC
jgi:hypothetical protein